MKSVNEMIEIVKDEIPEGAFIEGVEITRGLLDGEVASKSTGLKIALWGHRFTREQALEIYQKVRAKIPGLEKAAFSEEMDIEWEFELVEFVWQ